MMTDLSCVFSLTTILAVARQSLTENASYCRRALTDSEIDVVRASVRVVV